MVFLAFFPKNKERKDREPPYLRGLGFSRFRVRSGRLARNVRIVGRHGKLHAQGTFFLPYGICVVGRAGLVAHHMAQL